jgi:hypothetical protein
VPVLQLMSCRMPALERFNASIADEKYIKISIDPPKTKYHTFIIRAALV